MNKTILYISANREPEKFTQLLRDNIISLKGDVPIISVTQKPINFGQNICVGEQESSYYNEFRQILIGLRKIKTPFTLVCEDDFLYPPDYFGFTPSEMDTCYRYKNVWIQYTLRGITPKFRFKGYSEGAQIIDTVMWRDALEEGYKNFPEWQGKDAPSIPAPRFKSRDEYSWTGDPAVSFKTSFGVRRHTKVLDQDPVFELPYWGTALDVRKKYYD